MSDGSVTPRPLDWKAIEADPKFRALHRRKSRFLWGLMVGAIGVYFLLPLGAAYVPALYAHRLWGPINVGLVFALSQFLIAWSVAFWYARRASEFDRIAHEIAARAAEIKR